MAENKPETQLAIVSPDPMVPTTLQSCIDFANIMAKGNLIPAHLKNPADCLRVVIQASKWQLDPFAVADKTSLINGKLMHEGQLVMGVINSRANLSERLRYDYKGEGDARVLTVTGKIKGESEPRSIELPFSLAKRINKNGQMGINPDQQAAYIGARLWARRHMPELMMGIYTPDETPDEPINVTPGADPANRDEPPAKETAATGAAAATEKRRGRPPGSKNAEKPAEQPPIEAEVVKPPQAPRKTLNAHEQATFVCFVKSLRADMVTSGGTPHPSVIAELTGEFEGTVYHLGGAPAKDGVLVPLAAWQPDKPVEITLVGKPRKDPKAPCNIFVESIKIHEPVAPTAPAAQETGGDID